jgi:hypothetical protein
MDESKHQKQKAVATILLLSMQHAFQIALNDLVRVGVADLSWLDATEAAVISGLKGTSAEGLDMETTEAAALASALATMTDYFAQIREELSGKARGD